MPTYQYRCTHCQQELEVVQKFSDSALTVCPNCQGQLRKIYNAVGVVFKGSGFYRTDSRGPDTSEGAGRKDAKSESGAKGSDGNGSGAKESGSKGSGDQGSGGQGSGAQGSGGGSGGTGSSGSGSTTSSSGGSGSGGSGSGGSGAKAPAGSSSSR